MKYRLSEWVKFLLAPYEELILSDTLDDVRDTYSSYVIDILKSDFKLLDLGSVDISTDDGRDTISFLLFGSWAGHGVNLIEPAGHIELPITDGIRELDSIVSSHRDDGDGAGKRLRDASQALSNLIFEVEYKCEEHEESEESLDELNSSDQSLVEEFKRDLESIK
jgi:hypothetical protein